MRKKVIKTFRKIFSRTGLTVVVSLGLVGALLMFNSLVDLLPTGVGTFYKLAIGFMLIALSIYIAKEYYNF